MLSTTPRTNPTFKSFKPWGLNDDADTSLHIGFFFEKQSGLTNHTDMVWIAQAMFWATALHYVVPFSETFTRSHKIFVRRDVVPVSLCEDSIQELRPTRHGHFILRVSLVSLAKPSNLFVSRTGHKLSYFHSYLYVSFIIVGRQRTDLVATKLPVSFRWLSTLFTHWRNFKHLFHFPALSTTNSSLLQYSFQFPSSQNFPHTCSIIAMINMMFVFPILISLFCYLIQSSLASRPSMLTYFGTSSLKSSRPVNKVDTRRQSQLPASMPCNLSFCALYGGRTRCVLDVQNDNVSLTPITCSGWVMKPPKINCEFPCPPLCNSLDDRPVASDGVAYCTDCSLIRSSCRSRFDIVGPIARGVENAITIEIPLSVSPSPSSSPSPSPMNSVFIGPTIISNPTVSQSYGQLESPEPSAEFSVAPTMEVSLEPSVAATSEETVEPWQSHHRTLSPSMLWGPCIHVGTMEQQMSCCVHEGKWCVKTGGKCSASVQTANELTSPESSIKLQNRTYGVCSRGDECVISDFGPYPERSDLHGTCEYVPTAPTCSVSECARHGFSHICILDSHLPTWVTTTCGAWATRNDGGRRPNCHRICTMECASRNARPVANDGSRYCSLCSLITSSCMKNFTVWGPVQVGPHLQ